MRGTRSSSGSSPPWAPREYPRRGNAPWGKIREAGGAGDQHQKVAQSVPDLGMEGGRTEESGPERGRHRDHARTRRETVVQNLPQRGEATRRCREEARTSVPGGGMGQQLHDLRVLLDLDAGRQGRRHLSVVAGDEERRALPSPSSHPVANEPDQPRQLTDLEVDELGQRTASMLHRVQLIPVDEDDRRRSRSVQEFGEQVSHIRGGGVRHDPRRRRTAAE